MNGQEQALARYYASMNDDELLQVASNRESLIYVAQTALATELEKRGKNTFSVPPSRVQQQASRVQQQDVGSRGWWPRIVDEQTAKKASAEGAVTAFLVAGVTAIFATISIFTPVGVVHPSSLEDALVFALLGLIILRKTSRTAAVAALVMFVAERFYAGVQHGVGAAVGVTSAFLVLGFIAGVRGTFAFHAYRSGTSLTGKKTRA